MTELEEWAFHREKENGRDDVDAEFDAKNRGRRKRDRLD
jgi:hypothetical protein